VVVRRQEHAQPGDIVVALVDGEATVSASRDGQAVVLRPGHPTMPPIVVRPVNTRCTSSAGWSAW
jgi:SOS-response transcriptional repressor LexA